MVKNDIQETVTVARGLEGVSAAETSISFVDGENGQLFYQGYNIHHLAERVSHDEIIYLLWHGELPTEEQLEEFRAELIPEMKLPDDLIRWIKNVPKEAHPMNVLRISVSMLGMLDPDYGDNSPEANLKKAMRITAKVPVIVAWVHRSRNDSEPGEPDLNKSLAHNFMEMFIGRELDEDEVRVVELLMLLHAEHGMNASTFTARVTASTLADMYAAVTSAIGTLSGSLHGGANQRVMEMLEDISNPEIVVQYIDGLLADGKRVMGFGHRVYKVEDPRACHLRRWSGELCCSRKQFRELYEISHKIERKVMSEKHFHPNVDFYSATVQHALGIPKDYFTAIFASSRVVGWTAHVIEQHRDNRLIRPTSKYIGQYGRRFVPIEKRYERKASIPPSEQSDSIISTD